MEEQKGQPSACNFQYTQSKSDDVTETRPPPPPQQPQYQQQQQHHQRPQRPASLSTSEPSLRFPRPQGSRHLASWVSSSQPDIMGPSSSDVHNPAPSSNLGDSTYELINTDDESQDGTAPESLDSFGCPRADDVHSLAGTEHSCGGFSTESDSEEEEEEEEEEADVDEDPGNESRSYADESLQRPSPRAASPLNIADEHVDENDVDDGDADKTPQMGSRLAQSIEFHEADDPVFVKKISVKHTIRGLTDEEAACLTGTLGPPESSKRLMAAIRQTMAQTYISTEETLRVLYVGSPEARHGIIHKISSALGASMNSDSQRDGSRDMLPTSPSTPKVSTIEDFIRISPFQLKVEDCTSAQKIVYKGHQFPDETVYAICLDRGRTYKSAVHPSGSVVNPSWSLPHLAVFYATEDDDDNARKTRDAAWEFLNRHSIPSIFISRRQNFEQPIESWSKYIDQHAVHLCIESSDRRMTPIRLPVDLRSFLNIDSRQMNRNLAYVTGMLQQAAEQSPKESEYNTTGACSMKLVRETKEHILAWLRGAGRGTLLQFFLFGLSIGIATLLSLHLRTSDSAFPAGITTTQAQTSTALASVVPESTAVATVTTSSAVQIPRANATPTSSAHIPFSNLFQDLAPPEPGAATVCSVKKHGRNEILIKIPLSTKTTWLAKDSISIDVLSGAKVVKTKFSSIDEGLLVEIPRQDAHGLISINIVTNRRPKVNETFEVDFGKSIVEEAFDLGKFMARKVADVANEAGEKAESVKDSMMTEFREATGKFTAEASDAAQRIKDSWGPSADALTDALAERWKQWQSEITQRRPDAEDYVDQLDLSVLRAQVAARLWWLRVQGKQEEHDEYQRKATTFVNKKLAAAIGAREARQRGSRGPGCQSRLAKWSKQCAT